MAASTLTENSPVVAVLGDLRRSQRDLAFHGSCAPPPKPTALIFFRSPQRPVPEKSEAPTDCERGMRPPSVQDIPVVSLHWLFELHLLISRIIP